MLDPPISFFQNSRLMPKARLRVNGSPERFREGFRVSNFVTEFRKPKDSNGDRLLHAGPNLLGTTAIEAKIKAAKLNRTRNYHQRIRVVNG
jgi:hypothetical protein